MNKIIYMLVLLGAFSCTYGDSNEFSEAKEIKTGINITADLFVDINDIIYSKVSIANYSDNVFFLEKSNVCMDRKDFRRDVLSIGTVGEGEKIFGYEGFIDDSFSSERYAEDYVNIAPGKTLSMYFNVKEFYEIGAYSGQVVYRFDSYNNNLDYTDRSLKSSLKFISLSNLPVLDKVLSTSCEVTIN